MKFEIFRFDYTDVDLSIFFFTNPILKPNNVYSGRHQKGGTSYEAVGSFSLALISTYRFRR